MLRILVVTSRFPDRLRPNLGIFIERQTLELAARPGVEVEVVAPLERPPFPISLVRSRDLDRLPAAEMWKGIPVHRLRFPRFRGLPSLRPWSLGRKLLLHATALRERFPFDVISAEFSWPEGPAAIAAGRALGVPVTIKARGMEFECRTGNAGLRRQLLESGLAAQRLLAVSASVKRSMTAIGLPAERIFVHHSGLDSDLFRPIDGRSTRARLGIAGPLLLAVGNLIPEKGHKLAVEALARIEGATLIIAGEGPERSALLARARQLGVADRLRLPGSLPQALLPLFYSAADVTIHPSRFEGFGNARLESLACGTPLVTTAVGDGAVIVDRPAAGRIVEPDPEAIAEAVKSVLADPPSAADVRACVAGFSWAVQAETLEPTASAASPFFGSAALQPNQRFVEGREEARSVGPGEGGGPAAGAVHPGAKVGHDRPGRDRRSDRRGGEELAVGPDHGRSGLQAAVGKQYVSSDHDRSRPGPFGDPVVRRVEAGPDDHPLDERMRRHPKMRVADDLHFGPVAESDLVDLLLHRAGVGVDEDEGRVAHGRSAVSPRPARSAAAPRRGGRSGPCPPPRP
jgi:glycosyltransferase involved in cell wall biosynthesis